MTEARQPEALEHIPPRFELEQSDDYSKYLLHSKSEILAVLRSIIQKKAMLTVHFDQGKSFFLTSMLSLSPDNRDFIFDVSSNDETNRKALQANKLISTTVVDKVKVQFSLNGLSSTQSEGRPAFMGAIPETLLRLQRREYFRLTTPVAAPVKLCAAVNSDQGVQAVETPLFDISGGGVGLMATQNQALFFRKGDTLDDCKILLPGEGLLVVALCVRNMLDVTTRSGSRYVRVGCQFVDLPPSRLTAVQRYITRVERERKARLTGLA